MDAYVGEIRMFSGSYAPQDWHLCDGALLPVSQNQALFALIGTVYGGDGVNNFALPDLRGRLPIGQGQGPGLTAHTLAQTGGTETVALNAATIPAHTHTFNTLAAPATTGTLTPDVGGVPGTLTYAQGANGAKTYMNNSTAAPTSVTLHPASVTNSVPGQSAPHQNMMPSFVTNFIICLIGIFPQQP